LAEKDVQSVYKTNNTTPKTTNTKQHEQQQQQNEQQFAPVRRELSVTSALNDIRAQLTNATVAEPNVNNPSTCTHRFSDCFLLFFLKKTRRK